VRLANSDDLMFQSQARRILSGLELFKEVILDFNGIEYISQAFADEIFRVLEHRQRRKVRPDSLHKQRRQRYQR